MDYSDAIHWRYIETSLKVHPEFEDLAYQYVLQFLGYVPIDAICRRHILFIQTAVANWKAGTLNDEAFISEVDAHIKNMRNDDMDACGYSSKSKFSEEDYTLYETHLSELKDRAYNRLSQFIETELPKEYSIDAELMMRAFLLGDSYYSGDKCDPMDYRAATILYFQYNLFTNGLTVAQNSPPFRMMVLKEFNVCPTDLEQKPR